MRARTAFALAAIACAALPASAAAAPELEIPEVPQETFKVQVKGVQKTVWSYDVRATARCDHGGTGSGTEVTRFSTRKPQVMVATRLGKRFVSFITPGSGGQLGASDIDGRATVTRQGKIVSEPLDPKCEGTDGNHGSGQPALPPDCGTKRASFGFSVGYQPARRRPGVTLREQTVPMPPLFKNCPVNGVSFPDLLDSSSALYKQVSSEWPVKEIFDRSIGKTILIGRGKRVANGDGRLQTTTIRWEVTFVRVKAKS